MALKSAVEKSMHRPTIDKMLKEGKTTRFISKWLKNHKKNPESISHVSIHNYKKNKFNIKKEAVRKYNDKKSKELLDKESDKVASDLEALDEIIQEGRKLELNIDSIQPDPENGVSPLEIEKTKIQAKNLVIRAAKTKYDITKDDPDPVNVNVNINQKEKVERLRRIEKDESDQPITSRAKLKTGIIKGN